jgi:hypothetical protein
MEQLFFIETVLFIPRTIMPLSFAFKSVLSHKVSGSYMILQEIYIFKLHQCNFTSPVGLAYNFEEKHESLYVSLLPETR